MESYVRAYGAECPSCRRPLPGPADHCPWCRVPLRLGVKITELYLLAWGIVLTASVLVAGCGLLMLFCVIRTPNLLDRGDILYRLAIGGICGLGVVMAIASVLLVLTRRAFCRLPRPAQWSLATVALVILLGCLVGIGIWVR